MWERKLLMSLHVRTQTVPSLCHHTVQCMGWTIWICPALPWDPQREFCWTENWHGHMTKDTPVDPEILAGVTVIFPLWPCRCCSEMRQNLLICEVL